MRLFKLFISFFLITSCQKEISFENPIKDAIITTTVDTVKLKKFIIIDTTIIPYDTISTFNYTYDNIGRCIKILRNDFPNDYTIVNNYYNGNDTTIIARKCPIFFSSSFALEEKFTYANGKMIADSVYDYTPNSTFPNVFKYLYMNNGVIYQYTTVSNSFLYEGKFYKQILNDNTVNEKDTFKLIQGIFSFQPIVSNINISLDSKINPFYKLYPKRPVSIEYENFATDDTYGLPGSFIQKNNCTSFNATHNNLITNQPVLLNQNFTYNYQYNSNSYPTVVIMKNITTGKINKGIYVY